MPKKDGQIVYNHSRTTRSVAPGVKLQPGPNVVDGEVWSRLCENDQRVRDLLTTGENGGLTTRTIKTDALERLARGESPGKVFEALTIDQQAQVASMIEDPAMLKRAQAESTYPQITAIIARRIAALGKKRGEPDEPSSGAEDEEPVTTRRTGNKKGKGA
jgi:hypothetical protein